MTGSVALRYLVLDACDGPFGSSLTSDHYSDEGARVVRLGNIGANEWRDEDAAFVPLGYWRALRKHHVEAGDLLIAGLGDKSQALGRSVVAPSLGPALVKADCFRLRLDHALVDARFVAYFMSSRGAELATQRAHGSTRQRLPLGDMLSLRIPVPPVAIQRRIADMLDAETAGIDTLIEKNERVMQLVWLRYRVLRRQLLAGGFLLGSPGARSWAESRGWRVAPLWLLSVNHDSRRIPLNAEERGLRQGPFPYWGANSVQDYIDGWLFDGPHVLIGEDGAPYFVDERDVAWVADGRYWVNNHAHVIEAVDVEPWWLAECLNVVDYSLFITGSTRDKLTQESLNRIPIPVPEPGEQARVLKNLGHSRELAATLADSCRRQQELLRLRRQALITAAVTGQIDV